MHSCVFEEILIYANIYINYKCLVLRALNKDSVDLVAALPQTVSRGILPVPFNSSLPLHNLSGTFGERIFLCISKQDIFIWMTN